jgi:hypothetical protein
MHKMEAQQPIPARPGNVLMSIFARDRELFIKRAFYTGDEWGVSCGLTPPGMKKTPIICSITRVCQLRTVRVSDTFTGEH